MAGGRGILKCCVMLNLFEHTDAPHVSVDHNLHQFMSTGIWLLSINAELDVLKCNQYKIELEFQSTAFIWFANVKLSITPLARSLLLIVSIAPNWGLK